MLRFSGNARLPMIHQSETSECGLACLAMVSGYHGFNTSLQEMRSRYGVSLKGLTLRGLMDIASAVKFSTRALRIELNELGKVQLPAILHWDFNHFVTLKKVTRKYIEVHNPALGVRKYELHEAGTHFTGIALELSPTADFSRGENAPRLRLSQIWGDLRGLNRLLVQILALSMVIQLVSLASPFYMQLVVDEVLIKQDRSLLNVLGLGFFGLTMIAVFTTVLRSYGQLYLVNQINFALGSSLFHHLIRLPLDYFHKRHMGDVVSRFGSIRNIQEFVTDSALIVFLDGIMAITTLVMIFIYSPLLSFIILTCLTLYALLRIAMFAPLRNRTHESIAKAASQESNFMESVRAIKSIKAFARESDREGIWNNRLADTINSEIRIGKLTIGYELIDGFLTGTCQVLVVFVGATQVIEGVLSLGMLYAFMSYQWHFSSAMTSLINQLIKIMMIKLHLERLADIALTPMEPGLDNVSSFSVQLRLRILVFVIRPQTRQSLPTLT
jgi:ATP-binding cassette subfamily B protein RaxB